MKIGITTFQWADNYGAVLQAHALQSFLQSRGYEVQIVDYRPQKSGSLARRWLSASPRGCVRKWELRYKERLFESFRINYLKRTSEVFYSADGLVRIKDRFDLLITGSDQVWNPEWLAQIAGLPELYFLSFAGSNTRLISYAASIGHSGIGTMTGEWQQILAGKLKQMDAISVREHSGVDVVRDLCGRDDAVQVVDPTLLLDRGHYDEMIGFRKLRGGTLLSYMLHGLEQDAETTSRCIAESKGLRVVHCDARKTRLHSGYTLPSPIGWMRQIRDASFVVTNSFHATVFCLIFHIPFVAVLIDGQIGSMNSRITDLLKMSGLSHRIANIGGHVSTEVLNEKIDWDAVDGKLVFARGESMDFLKEHEL